MRITLTESEVISIWSAVDQLGDLLERGAEGQAERELKRDIRNLMRIFEKAKKAKANPQPSRAP